MAKNMKKEYWDLTERPHTVLKLKILEEYLNVWADFLLNMGLKRGWKTYQDIYYVDCFAGRGKYHKDGVKDSFPGSPLLGLNCALKMNEKFHGKANVHCILVEKNRANFENLQQVCADFEGKVDFELRNCDFNDCYEEVMAKIDSNASFFFIDPWGIQIQKSTLEAIANKKGGPNDVLINYIKGGTERIAGLMKKTDLNDLIRLDEREAMKRIKTFKTLESFYGMSIYKNLDKTERERLKEWIETIKSSGELEEFAVFDMSYPKRRDAIYYLIFGSKKQVANKIIKHIFKKAKETTFEGQQRLFVLSDQFDLDK